MSTHVRTSPPGDYRRKPRKKRVPSERDFAIYAAHRAAVRTQSELASEFRVSQSRISQILSRVEWWLKTQPESGQSPLEAVGREQIAWRLEQERLESIFQRAVRGHDRLKGTIHTTRRRFGPEGQLIEQTQSEVPLHPQFLKIALRTSREKLRLSRRAARNLDNLSDAQRYALAVRLLVPLRRQAEEAGRVELCDDPEAAVATAVGVLLGTRRGTEGAEGNPNAVGNKGGEAEAISSTKPSNLSANIRGTFGDNPATTVVAEVQAAEGLAAPPAA